ncbi:MAG: hypothetical protein ABTR07_11420 [Candidatus Competibacter denitrificans]
MQQKHAFPPLRAVVTDKAGNVLLARMMTREEIGLSQKQYIRSASGQGIDSLPRPQRVAPDRAPILDQGDGHFVDGATLVAAFAVCVLGIIGVVSLLAWGL